MALARDTDRSSPHKCSADVAGAGARVESRVDADRPQAVGMAEIPDIPTAEGWRA
jgi:hypothetical protein